ncbi:hypothetical protein KG089_03470 [Carnobacteriaceae bacterium zg-ZUI252]|nr:hypothetical protein [Carnobacteriaceae bacterium zg-ZUI252]MBS4769994.1 hypothetical protein [Carnobacteriaceae bacterium zg-ZUI240]
MKPIKFKKNKGFISLMVVGILFIALAIFTYVIKADETAEKMYAAGKVYRRSANIKADESMAVAIQATSALAGKKDGNAYYIIETEEYDYIVLEVPENTTLFNAEKGKRFDTPLKLAVKSGKWSEETQEKFKALAKSIGLESEFESVYLLSTVELENDHFWAPIISLFMGILGVFTVYGGFSRRKQNKVTYMEITQNYPELRNDFSLIQTDGLYASEKLKLYIYKNHLMNLRSGFNALNLPNVKWLDFKKVRFRGATTASLLYLLVDEEIVQEFDLGKYRKKNAEDIDRLFEVLAEQFTHIAIGQENRPNDAVGVSNKKTIAEFVAEKQAQEAAALAQKTSQEDVTQENDVLDDNPKNEDDTNDRVNEASVVANDSDNLVDAESEHNDMQSAKEIAEATDQKGTKNDQ